MNTLLPPAKGDTVSFKGANGLTAHGRVTNLINQTVIVWVKHIGVMRVPLEEITVEKRKGQVDPREHSEKGLETLRLMGTVPTDWGLTPIKWEHKLIKINGWIECPVCHGEGEVGTVNGKLVQRSTAWNAMKSETIKVCENCPRVKFTKVGRSYAWKHSSEKFYRESDGHHGAAHSRAVNYSFMNGLVKAQVTVQRLIGTVLWAKDTKFDSRFRMKWGATTGHRECELCAKAIPSGRLVPVNGKDQAGNVHGAWIGEDCARKFFGIKAFKPEQIIETPEVK